MTVAVAVAREGALRYLAVPVTRGRSGALAVDAYPSLVGGPRLASDVQAGSQDDVGDAALAAVVKRALGNYLAGAGANLAADLDRGVQLSAPAEPLTLQGVDSLTWAGPGRVDAQLVARAAGGATYTLRYEVGVVRRDRWFVRGLNPAVQATAEKGATTR